MRPPAELVSGWYPPERSASDEWVWMGHHSVTRLPPRNGKGALHLAFDVPDELMSSPPTVTIMMNGAIVDRFKPTESHMTREYEVDAAPNGAPNVLELDTDKVVNEVQQHLGTDPRDLGILVKWLSWGAP